MLLDMNRNKIITISFLGVLAGTSLLSAAVRPRGFSPSENRYLQKKPEFTVEGLVDGSYGTKYEKYLSDQFPGRNTWIGIKVGAELIQGRRDVNQVYFGRDDYLIEKFDLEDVEGGLLNKNLERLKAFASDAGERLGQNRVRVMLVPSASQVMNDKLPFLAAPYDQSKVSDRLKEAVGVNAVVPVEDMMTAHNQQQLYYRTDHHWTALGAYYGYRVWAESMEMEPWEPEMFEIQTVSREFLGTVYSKVNVPHKPDSIERYLPKSQPAYEVYYDGAEEPEPMYNLKSLDGKDKYTIYMDGNHGLTEVKNPEAAKQTDRKLLIIKDSFANSFAPFAVNHYGETYMVDLRYFNMDVQLFMEEKEITDVLVLYQIPGLAKEKTLSKIIRN